MTAVALGICVCLLVVAARATVAHSEAALMDLGRHLSFIAEAGVGQEHRALVINGQALGFRVLSVEAAPESVLDYYESWCRGGDSELPVDLAAAGAIRTTERQDTSWRDLTLRSRDGDDGFVACVHTGPTRLSGEILLDRLAAFASSGDLSEVGRFHYVFVKAFGSSTRVVAIWTGRGFNPLALFPDAGDAPGLDMPGVPRPPGSRRLLSAGEARESAYLVHYERDGESLGAIAGFYRAHFASNGWQLLADSGDEAGGRSFVAQRGTFLFVIRVEASGGSTTVTIARAE